jgi:hypothetical protein
MYLSGDALAASRRFVVSWLVEPAADAMNEVGEPVSEEESLYQLRQSVSLLERIGWPGTPLRRVAVNEEVRCEQRRWGNEAALGTLDGVRALLDQIGWDDRGASRGRVSEPAPDCRRTARRGGW